MRNPLQSKKRPDGLKDAVTHEILKAPLESKIRDKSPSLSDFRSVALCLIAYAVFFRFCELCHIKGPPY